MPGRPERPHRVAVASDESLVVEAVRAALYSHGLTTTAVGWPEATLSPDPGSLPQDPDVALVLCELGDPGHRCAVGRLVDSLEGVPVIVVTATPSGPAWGAMLRRGVAAVLPNAVTLDEVVMLVERAAAGEQLTSAEDRAKLVALWRASRHGGTDGEPRGRAVLGRFRPLG